ncbi:MAG: glycosyltransferase, partial [Planctomycetales bacterium]
MPIRTCYVIDSLGNGGTERRLLRLLRSLDRAKVEPSLALLKSDLDWTKQLADLNVPTLALDVPSLGSWRAVREGVKLWRFLREQRVDVVQLHFRDATYFGAAVAKCAGARRIVGTRYNMGYWKSPADHVLFRLCSRLFLDAVVVNCEACRESVEREDRVPRDRIEIIVNGIDLDRFETDDRPREAGPTVGMVANLRAVKRVDLFLRAAAEVLRIRPDACFRVAGQGEELSALRALADELNIASRVEFLGAIEDVPGFLAELDVAVLCSSSEGMSNAVLEYLASAKPGVATAV